MPKLSMMTKPSPTCSPADLELLRRFQLRGDQAAFAELLKRHWPMVAASCRRRLVEPGQAEDAAQETFLLLSRKAFWFRREVMVGGWLHHAAGNICRTMNRSHRRRLVRETEAAPSHEAEERTDAMERLDEALAALPGKLRDAVVLCHLEGRSRQEAAAMLGCGENAVSKRLGRATERLREVMTDQRSAGTAVLAALAAAGDEASGAVPTARILAAVKASGGPGASIAGLAASSALWPVPLTLTLLGAVLWMMGSHESSLAVAKAAAAAEETEVKAAETRTFKKSVETPGLLPPSSRFKRSESRISRNGAAKELNMEVLVLLRRFHTNQELEDYLQKLFAGRDGEAARSALRAELGLDLSEEEVTSLMGTSKDFTQGVMKLLAARYPHETLAMMVAMSEGGVSTRSLGLFAEWNPNLDLAEAERRLPRGPSQDIVRTALRAHIDPVLELDRLRGMGGDEASRLEALKKFAAMVPEGSASKVADWALANLSEAERRAVFVPSLLYNLSHADPTKALAVLQSMPPDEAEISNLLQASMRGLVQEGGRTEEVLALIDRLDGKPRQQAIEELARRWVRHDEAGLLTWMRTRDNAADVDAALPLTLPQLSEKNFTAVLDAMIPQLDGKLDEALIRAAMPSLLGAESRSVRIIDRMIAQPGYGPLSGSAEGNRALLWNAVNTTVDGWVSQSGGDPNTAAQWVERVPFETPADREVVMRKVYDQWKASDPVAARQWGQRVFNGKVPD